MRELEALIASALKQARAIGISITPKWHLLEDHILDQHIWLVVKNGWGVGPILGEAQVPKNGHSSFRRRITA